MSDAAAIANEMRGITRRAAGPVLPGDSVKAAIRRAARALGISYRRARSFWYGESVAVRAVEADRMRAADLLLLARRERRLEHELAAIKTRLDATDQKDARAAAAVAFRQGARSAGKAGAVRGDPDCGGEAPGGQHMTPNAARRRR